MVPFSIKGPVAPVFTPVHEDFTINYDTIPEYMKFLADGGISSVLVAGTTGEGTSLNVEERKQLVEEWTNEAKTYDAQVIVQVGGAPHPDVLELARHAERIKASAILTLPELYFKPSSTEDLVVYLEQVSQAAPSLPLLYYHFPTMSGVNVDVRKLFKLAVTRIPNFKGMKADLGVALQVAEYLTEDRVVFNGNHLLAPAALLNHESSIATVTNLFPNLVKEILDSVTSSDLKQARLKQEKMNKLVDSIASQGSWVPAMKYSMELVSGLNVGPPRPPLRPLDQGQKTSIARSLRDAFPLYKGPSSTKISSACLISTVDGNIDKQQ